MTKPKPSIHPSASTTTLDARIDYDVSIIQSCSTLSSMLASLIEMCEMRSLIENEIIVQPTTTTTITIGSGRGNSSSVGPPTRRIRKFRANLLDATAVTATTTTSADRHHRDKDDDDDDEMIVDGENDDSDKEDDDEQQQQQQQQQQDEENEGGHQIRVVFKRKSDQNYRHVDTVPLRRNSTSKSSGNMSNNENMTDEEDEDDRHDGDEEEEEEEEDDGIGGAGGGEEEEDEDHHRHNMSAANASVSSDSATTTITTTSTTTTAQVPHKIQIINWKGGRYYIRQDVVLLTGITAINQKLTDNYKRDMGHEAFITVSKKYYEDLRKQQPAINTHHFKQLDKVRKRGRALRLMKLYSVQFVEYLLGQHHHHSGGNATL